jgi:hypothetical protein
LVHGRRRRRRRRRKGTVECRAHRRVHKHLVILSLSCFLSLLNFHLSCGCVVAVHHRGVVHHRSAEAETHARIAETHARVAETHARVAEATRSGVAKADRLRTVEEVVGSSTNGNTAHRSALDTAGATVVG